MGACGFRANKSGGMGALGFLGGFCKRRNVAMFPGANGTPSNACILTTATLAMYVQNNLDL